MPKVAWFQFVLKTVFRNLWRKPRRTLVVLITIALAVSCMILFRSFVEGVKKTFRHNIVHSEVGQYQIYRKGYLAHKAEDPFGYPIENLAALKKVIEDEVAPLILFSGRQDFFALLNHKDRSISARGISTDATAEKSYLSLHKVISGRHLSEGPENSIFMGVGLAKQLEVKSGDTLTLVVNTAGGSLNAWDVEVVGLFKSGINEIDDNLFHIHSTLGQKLLRTKGDAKILVAFNDENDLLFKQPLTRTLAKGFPDLEAVHWHDIMGDYFDNSVGWLDSIFFVFQIIMLVVATLGIVNIFMINLFERVGEIATLRAIGTARSEITLIILLESLIQSLFGAALGVALAFIITSVFLRNGIRMPPPPAMSGDYLVLMKIDAVGIIFSVVLAVIVAGGSGIFPAIRMARTNLVKALGANV